MSKCSAILKQVKYKKKGQERRGKSEKMPRGCGKSSSSSECSGTSSTSSSATSFSAERPAKKTHRKPPGKVGKVMRELLPAKCKKQYEKAFADFKEYSKFRNCPTEDQMLLYFDHLKGKGLAAKTLWSKFSMICTVLKTSHWKDGNSQTFPRVTAFLKRAEDDADGSKQAKTFTVEEVEQFLGMDSSQENSDQLLLLKAYLATGFFGGLRTAENYSLKKCDISTDDLGHWIVYDPKKQRGSKKRSTFLVPKTSPGFTALTTYLESVPEGHEFLWHGLKWAGKGKTAGFKISRLGINTCRKLSVQIAKTLGLPDPDRFTGHGIRRSSATRMADSGASLSEIMRFFNWSSVKTAQTYLDTSKSLLSSLSDRLQTMPKPSPTPKASEPSDPVQPPSKSLLQGFPVQPQAQSTGNVYYFSNIAEGAVITINDARHTRPEAPKSESD